MVKEYLYSKVGNIKLSEHFTLSEFRSRDGEDKILVSEELIEKLEKLRTELNCSRIKINSGYRTSKVDKEVGASGNGTHTKGLSADIQCYDLDGKIIDAKYVCMKAQDIGFNGIGYISKLATHLDVRDYIWYRDESKGYLVVKDWYDYFNVSKIPFNLNDIIYPIEDITLYSNIYKNGEKLVLNKNKKSIVRLIKGKFMCLGDDSIKYYYPAGWTDEYDKFSEESIIEDDPDITGLEKILLKIKELIEQALEFIKKLFKK